MPVYYSQEFGLEENILGLKKLNHSTKYLCDGQQEKTLVLWGPETSRLQEKACKTVP